jgi:ribosome-binding ATPase
VAGASRGEGLGNQFLSHIREVDAIVHVVRCFTGGDVVHVSGSVDPARDIEIVETELLLKDLETVQKRAERLSRGARSGDKALVREAEVVARLEAHLQAGEPARTFAASEDERAVYRDLYLLTGKPVLYAANVAEDDLAAWPPHDGDAGGGPMVDVVRAIAEKEGAGVVVICAEAEAQIAQLDESERAEFLQALGLQQSGLDRLVRAAYLLLELITFFTAGPKEARAWTVPAGTRAQQAAGEIHSDMERGFIRAEIIAYDDYVALGGEQGAKEAGKMRAEGRDYALADGEVVHFRFNV